MENFVVVQCVPLPGTHRSKKPAPARSNSPHPPSSRTAAWPRCGVRPVNSFRGDIGASPRLTGVWRRAATRRCIGCESAFRKPAPKMKDPSGGTTGRVKLYGALGVDGRSRRIQPMGGITAPTYISRSTSPNVQNAGRFFWPSVRGDCLEITAPLADWLHLRPIFPQPSTARSRSARGSRKRYRRPGHSLRQACRRPRQAEPPARRRPP